MTTNKGRKKSGGKYIQDRKKRLCEMTGQLKTTRLGEIRRKSKRTIGGGKRVFLLQANSVNVSLEDKKTKKATIKNVLETPSNRFLARQNIITKGSILDTDLGKVRVTNRPTQVGVVNGVLVE
ncbi:MAG TPA: 30S ribosomal protein S8e [Candidatus Nanoarchaeia archaeon]|nr:30S ribosomal protein S8e [Candidatus Nanoarchaeia archaeon]